MAEFHKGQEVEAWIAWPPWGWRKDGVVSYAFPVSKYGPQMYNVEFPDHTRCTFAEYHISALFPITIVDKEIVK